MLGKGAGMEEVGRGQEGTLAPPTGLKSALSHTSFAVPGSPPALEGGTVTSWGWFFSRNLMCPQASWAALVMAPPVSLAALLHHPGPISGSGISDSSGSQITRKGDRHSPPLPTRTCQTLFLSSIVLPAPPPAFPVLSQS